MTTTANLAAAVEAWTAYQAHTGSIKRPVTEEEYKALHALADALSSRYSLNAEPLGSLFDHITGLMHDWEVLNQPELKGFGKLYELIGERGVTQK